MTIVIFCKAGDWKFERKPRGRRQVVEARIRVRESRPSRDVTRRSLLSQTRGITVTLTAPPQNAPAGNAFGTRSLQSSSTYERGFRTTLTMMIKSHRCNWNWCRDAFATPRDLAYHLNHEHLNNITRVKRDDWDSWVEKQTGEDQPGVYGTSI